MSVMCRDFTTEGPSVGGLVSLWDGISVQEKALKYPEFLLDISADMVFLNPFTKSHQIPINGVIRPL